jgi:3-hydroxybutyryl-CoA dehydrogenase
MPIKTVGVLGCGLMGAGIAQVSAAAGYKTIVREVEEPLVRGGLARIDKFLAGGVEKGKLTADEKARTLANLTGTTMLEDLRGCDLVIEAIVENIDEKTKSYAVLDSILGEHAIVCSNTSSLCITELASKTKRPDRFAGLHFFNPVPLMKLGCGYPMGPFTLLDFVGLDTTYYIANIMFDEYREPAYAPPPLLKRMVLAGRLGRKSGHGFYKYP